MKISERDLFNFVFFRYLVEDEKVKYLETTDLFKEEIELLSSFKEAEAKELPPDLKIKLSKAIPYYKLSNVVELYPVTVKKFRKRNDGILRFAADSAELQPKTSSQTFSDENNRYLIKLIKSGNDTKIYLFSTKNEVLKNIELTVEPQNLKFYMEDNYKPLELKNFTNIQKIKLEFFQVSTN